MFLFIITEKFEPGFIRNKILPYSYINLSDQEHDIIISTSYPVQFDLIQYENETIVQNQTEHIFPDALLIHNSEVRMKTFSDLTQFTHFWRIPKNYCSQSSLFLSGDYMVNINQNVLDLPDEFCIFPQFRATQYMCHVQFLSNNDLCFLEFYSTHFVADKPKYICQNNEFCQYKFLSPFFIRSKNCSYYDFQISLEVTTVRPHLHFMNCDFSVLKTITPNSISRAKNIFSNYSISCFDTATQFLSIFWKAISIYAFFSFLLLYLCYFIVSHHDIH